MQHGTWGDKWLHRASTSCKHLQRHNAPTNLASVLLQHHDFEWLQAQRLRATSSSLLAGRTNTRAVRSKVHK
eukprot:1174930-Karenia_brevis.AAC.1